MALRLLMVTLSLVVLAAHFFRSGPLFLLAVCAVVLFIAFVRMPWAPTVVRVALILGSIEWIRTAFELAAARTAMGHSATRLLAILLGVAAFTLVSGLILRGERVTEFYSEHASPEEG